MKFKALLAGFLANAAMAWRVDRSHPSFKPEMPSSCKEHLNDLSSSSWQQPTYHYEKRATITVKVYVHVVYSETGGNVPDGTVNEQIDVLNKAFAYGGIAFALEEIDRTHNDAWSEDSTLNATMMQALHKGNAADLNFYIVKTMIHGRLNAYQYPWLYQEQPATDGVTVLADALPGGKAPYDLGMSAVQSVGHWFGLYNTFRNGCNRPGDEVDDTPYEASPAFGCQQGRDSCPAPGVDLIHNYMDHSDDACLTEFTPGQMKRAREQANQFRGFPL